MTKADISRSNGARSNGPATAQGKAISARNAETHGLTSSRIVLPYESQEEYDKLEASFIARFKPADEVEHELVHEMAASRWRLRRIELMEAATFRKALREQQELQGPEADPMEIQAAAYSQVAESKTLRTLSRHQAQLRRSYEKAWKELEIIQADRIEEASETEETTGVQNEPSFELTEELLDLLTAPPTARRRAFSESSLS